jgi:hypothetical protein
MGSAAYQKQKQYQQAYDARHRDRRLAQKRAWWRRNKGHFGSRAEYEHYAKLTGGILRDIKRGENYKERTQKYRQAHGYDQAQ